MNMIPRSLQPIIGTASSIVSAINEHASNKSVKNAPSVIFDYLSLIIFLLNEISIISSVSVKS